MKVKEINDHYKKFYEKKNLIGKGQYGKVYKVINKKTKEIRAIKIMDIDEDENVFMSHMNNELKNMNICSNQNINSVKLYECFHFNNKFAIVMEFCDDNLQNILNKKKEGFTVGDIYIIMNQLNNTFKIMSENKIIHRDIKLENIVIKYNNEHNDSNLNFIAKLTDYGISKQLINTKGGKTNIGTSLTMAPEILKGGGEIYDNKCDLWSIGVIIYQLYFKDYPYKGDTEVAIYNQIITLGKKILKRTKNNTFDNLIDSLLISNPAERINYDEYFNHPFFKGNLSQIKININNYIISEIEIKEDNQNERIINSYEDYYKDHRDEIEKIDDEELRKILMNEENKNEKEIKDNCMIKINNEEIKFTYFHKFKKKGKYKIIYFFKKKLSNCNFMFWGCKSLISINLSNFETQNITNMYGMFRGDESLKNIDLSNFNTQNVKYMNYMFSGCESLTNIDLSKFDTQNVKYMNYMFSGCESLTNIDLSNFNTQNVINMRGMFWGCESLTNIDLSNFTNQNLTNMSSMFRGNESLTTIKLSNFNTQNVINMSDIFWGCISLTNIDLSNFNTNKVTNMSYMFNQCQSLISIDLSNFNNQNVSEMNDMFYECESLISINLSNFNTQNAKTMEGMFYGCKSLTNIDLSNFNTQNVVDMSYMFSECYSLESIDLSNFNIQNVTNVNGMFNGCKSLIGINLTNFNTQNVINMYCMFKGCKSLKNIDLSNFNTQNVISTCGMFWGCESLTNIELSNFNTKNVTNMSYMFSECYSLVSIELSNFNTQNVTDMYGMFWGCKSLTNIDLSNFNTKNVTNMRDMFFGCSSLAKEKIISNNRIIL